MKKFLLSLAAVALAGSAWADTYKLVSSIDEIGESADCLIVNTANKKAMSTTQNNNNRGASDVTITNNEIIPSENVAVVKITKITKDNGTEYSFYVTNGSDTGYLYAASSSSNYLRTQSDLASATVTIGTNGNAEIKFTNGFTRNLLRYNTSSKLFSCYSSGQGDVQLYIKSLTDTRTECGLSYPEAEYSVNFSEFDSFVAPKLDNPNNLEGITYDSSNHGPAMIDENTGVLTLYRIAGTTTITATFKGNDDFKPGTASYNLTVVDDRKDAELSFPETEYTANVGEAFNTPTLNNAYSLPVSFSSSDTNVATVDADGVVTIEGAGTTTITAKFAGNDEYKDGEALENPERTDPVRQVLIDPLKLF